MKSKIKYQPVPQLPSLALALLVPGIGTNNPDYAFAAYNFALAAHSFH
jgi:hypothetical protein